MRSEQVYWVFTVIPGERCTGLTRRRSRRAHSLSPNLRWTPPPIRPDLIYDRHRYSLAWRSGLPLLPMLEDVAMQKPVQIDADLYARAAAAAAREGKHVETT
jgi:hypothetical protein